MPEVQTPAQLRAAIGRATRLARLDPEDQRKQHRPDELRRAYRATLLEEYIQRTLRAAPPLSAEQRDKLAGLLLVTRRSTA